MTGWKLVALALVALGIGLRFVNLGNKPYWMDEAFTSLRVAGYLQSELMSDAFAGREMTVADLQIYQHLNPDHGPWRTVRTLIADDPHQPPLFFVMARIWAGIFGDSPAKLRALAAIIGVFTIPAMFWLCLELFRSRVTAWLAMVLMAVSPFQLAYAQEARAYSLLALMTLVSSALLLRANRLQRAGLWWAYAITIGAGLYSHLFFAYVPAAHGVYMIVITWQERGMTRRVWLDLKPYLLAAGAGTLMFAPWMMVIISGRKQVGYNMNWVFAPLGLSDLMKSWCTGFYSVFIDDNNSLNTSWNYCSGVPALLLIGLSICYLWRKTQMRNSLLVIALILCTAIPLIVADMVFGARISSVSRYWMPAYIGLQVAVGYLLSTNIMMVRTAWRRLWQAITATVVGAGIVSCAIFVCDETWRNKGGGTDSRQVAQILNHADHPLLMGSDKPGINLGKFLTLINMLDKSVHVRFFKDSRVPPLKEPLDGAFLLNPSKNMRRMLDENDQRVLVPITKSLWRLDEKRKVTDVISSSAPH